MAAVTKVAMVGALAVAACGGSFEGADAGDMGAAGGTSPVEVSQGARTTKPGPKPGPGPMQSSGGAPVMGQAGQGPVQAGAGPSTPSLPEPPSHAPAIPFAGDTLAGFEIVEFTGEDHGTLCATAMVGDMDGDGFDDILLGDGGGSGPPAAIELGVRGAQYLFYGRASFPAQLSVLDADLVVRGGGEAAPLGDLDADGYPDAGFVSNCDCESLATGAYCACQQASGLHLLFGGPERHQGQIRADAIVPSMPGQAWGVRSAGDLNADGYADFVVAADGAARVFYGSANLRLSPPSLLQPSATLTEDQASGWGVGDVDGDGYDDLLLASDYDSRLFYGRQTRLEGGLNDTADAIFSLPSHAWSNDPVGDVDGDGYADIGLGHYPGITFFYGGQARYWGTRGDQYRDFALLLESHNLDDMAVGDLNGDGIPDMLLGDSKDQTGGFQAGALFFAAGDGLRQTQDRIVGAEQSILHGAVVNEVTDLLGYCLTSGGDVNGDGFDDVLVGKPGNHVGDEGGGSVLLILGGPLSE